MVGGLNLDSLGKFFSKNNQIQTRAISFQYPRTYTASSKFFAANALFPSAFSASAIAGKGCEVTSME